MHRYDNSFEQLFSSIIGISSSIFTFALKHPANLSPLFGSLSAKQDDSVGSCEDSQPCSIWTSSKLLEEMVFCYQNCFDQLWEKNVKFPFVLQIVLTFGHQCWQLMILELWHHYWSQIFHMVSNIHHGVNLNIDLLIINTRSFYEWFHLYLTDSNPNWFVTNLYHQELKIQILKGKSGCKTNKGPFRL